MKKTPLNTEQTNWLLQAKQNVKWCNAYKGSASVVHRVYINGCYTQNEADLINKLIGPRYLIYLKKIK